MATISLEREIKLTSQDMDIIEQSAPTERYYEALRSPAMEVSKSDTIPGWMKKKA